MPAKPAVRSLAKNESGFAALVIGIVMVTVLSLVTVGFAQLMRKEQKSSLDKQLASTAYYAAESGINDAVSAINAGYTTAKPDCGPILSNAYLKSNVIDSSSNDPVKYSCLLIDPSPADVRFSSVGSNDDNSKIVRITGQAVDHTPTIIDKITVSWSAEDSTSAFAPAGWFTTGKFPAATAWQTPAPDSKAITGVLRTELVPLNNLSRASFKTGLYTSYLYPNAAATPDPTVYSATYADSQGDAAGKIYDGHCSTGKSPYHCSFTITNLSGPGMPNSTSYLLRLNSMYTTSSVKIEAFAPPPAANQLRIEGAQTAVDSTGNARGVLKRLQVRIPSTKNSLYPQFSIEGGSIVCKQLLSSPTKTFIKCLNPDGTEAIPPTYPSDPGITTCADGTTVIAPATCPTTPVDPGDPGDPGSCPTGFSGVPPNCVKVAGKCATGGAYLWANLVACGWPGPENTGPAAGTKLTPTANGERNITTSNVTIQNESFTGNIVIGGNASKNVTVSNVTIKNVVLTYQGKGSAGASAIRITSAASNVKIQNVRVIGGGKVHLCISTKGHDITIQAVDCSGTEDGMGSIDSSDMIAGSATNMTFKDNYIHDFIPKEYNSPDYGADGKTNNCKRSNGHVDGFQVASGKNITLSHNTWKVTLNQAGYKVTPGDPNYVCPGTTDRIPYRDGFPDSVMAIWSAFGDLDNVKVSNNLMAGGGFVFYAYDRSPSGAQPVGGFSTTNINIDDNVFSNAFYTCVGTHGLYFKAVKNSNVYGEGPTDGWRRSGNYVIETSKSGDAGNIGSCR